MVNMDRWKNRLNTAATLPARGARVARAFVADRSGATAVQAILMLPAILFFFGAGIKLWETINVRKSLHDGTYQAVRYLSLYPPQDVDEYLWATIAREIITTELENNPWVKQPVTEADLRVDVRINDSNSCLDEFSLESAYRLFGPVGPRDPTSPAGILPSRGLVELREERVGKVMCE
jgi:hypothetical protein